jgi:hypothetical protein
MAQLGVAGAGAVIGGIIGTFAGGNTVLGAQIGWALGGAAGALLFPPKGPDQTGPRLNDLATQTSGYGVAIPAIAGQVKLSGNVIWAQPLEERVTRRRQGKGGGGGARTTTYSYYANFAVGLGEWLIPPVSANVLRIWLDTRLVYDATGQSEVVTVPGLTWRFYEGAETQLPDPLIESVEGVGNTPAYRGLCYIVFEELPVEQFGNRTPNVTVEMASQTSTTAPQVLAAPPASPLFTSVPSNNTYRSNFANNVAVDHARGRIYEGRERTSTAGGWADEMIRVYDLATMETLSEHLLSDIYAAVFSGLPAGTSSSTGAGIMHLGVDGFLYVTGGGFNRIALFKIDPDTMSAVGVFGNPNGDGFGFGDNGTRLVIPYQITSIAVPRLDGTFRTLVIVQGAYSATLTIDGDQMEYIWGAGDVAISPPVVPTNLGIGGVTFPITLVPGRIRDDGGAELWYLRASELSGPPAVSVVRFRFYSGAADLGAGASMGIFRDDFDDIDVAAEIDASASRPLMQAAFYDPLDDSLVFTISGVGSPSSGWSRFSTVKWSPGAGVVWRVVDHAAPAFNDARGQTANVISGAWGIGGNFMVRPGSGDVLVNAAGAPWNNTLAWLDESQAVVGWTDGNRTLAKRFLLRQAAVALDVPSVVEAICGRAGLPSSRIEFGFSGGETPLRGYILARPMSARDAITPLAAAFQFDAVETDDVLRFVRRGGSVDATIGYDDLIRESPDENVLDEQRAQDAELPRELSVRYFDIERGWEQSAQRWSRAISPTAVVQSSAAGAIDLPIPLTAGEAKSIARQMVTATWRERTRMAFSLGPSWLRLTPTDVINVTTRDGAVLRCRVLSTQLGANWITRIEAVTEDAATYALTASGDTGTGRPDDVMPLPYRVRLIAPDMPLLADGDDLTGAGLREYAFVGAYDPARFRPVAVVRGEAGAWEQIGALGRQVDWGVVAAMPLPQPVRPHTWINQDHGVSGFAPAQIDVRMQRGAPDSATDLEVLNGANVGALVAPNGTAEIFQWQTATLQADGTYRLTRLLRGRRGTEDLLASRAPGNLFIMLDGARLAYQDVASAVATVRSLKAVTAYDTPDTALPVVPKASRGRAERPYSPAFVRGTRDGGQNLTITWLRRTRVGGDWVDGTGTVPLGEATEAYEVEITFGGTVVRTFTGLTSQTVTYTAAQQVTDFGATRSSVAVRIYQISNIVGRGVAAEATV